MYAPGTPAAPRAGGSAPGQAAWLIAPAAHARPPLTPADFPGWDSVEFDFPEPAPAPVPAPAPAPLLPGQRAAAEPDAPPVPAGQPAPRRSFLTGRRPSPLVLLAAAVLVAGAVTGQLLALLAGWGLAYIAPRLGPLTRKFAALVIPLGTMTAATVWQWGRTQGRWGTPAPAEELGRAVWADAPGALRTAGVLTAVFLLVVTMRRRKAVAEQAG
ncbi:hypothetical protein ACIRBX_31720 [Kitasatospora sp. NPDC096147]|uniref:hypothetical protein n=1 Tax=Kitasatospora sp. NPDC096147 TaxID=3364093 RepID=UPI0038105934